MTAKRMLWIAPALAALVLAGPVEAGGYKHGYKHGYYQPGHGAYAHRHKGHGYKSYRHGYRSGYRNAYRRHDFGHRAPYRAWRHGYRKGYRHGYGHAYGHRHRRSYYPKVYYYDPLLGHVRGIYGPSAGISLHFGY
jgi:hypothetical protein